MEPTYDRQVIKCPKCTFNINISVGRFAGGVNDSGGWVLQCASCDEKFSLPVKNPDDLSSVQSGAKILASWDNEMDNKAQVLAGHGLSEQAPDVPRLLIKEFGEPDSFFDLGVRHLYQCCVCSEPIEAAAYKELESHLKIVNAALGSHLIFYLASREAAPEGSSTRLPVRCKCSAEHQARFFRKFSEEHASDADEFWLVDVVGSGRTIDIDGVYSRDDCIAVLEKLLLRWRVIHNVVLLAVPFIGFNFPSALKKVPDLWNRVLKYTDPAKTAIVTRKATYKMFKDAAKGTEMDVEFFKDWGILNPTLETLEEKKAFFKTDFHAKFYCGMSSDGVETLVGSFNIHEGGYVENIHLLRYEFPDFAKRYLLGMNMLFDPQRLKNARRILEIQLEDGRVASRRVVSYEASLDSPLP